jgi:hypothetical protein
MNSARPQFVWKLLPSLRDFAFLMPIAFLFGKLDGAGTLLFCGDTGWHIRTGEWILRNHSVPTADPFSFSKAGEPWFAWEWLCDVLWAWLNAHGGLASIVVFCTMLLALTFGIVYKLAVRKSNPALALVITTIAAASSSLHWLARPHLFTLLFAVVFYAILERVREGRSRIWRVPALALLPLMMIPWTNLHGGFFVGVLMVGAYAGGELANMALASSRESRLRSLRAARPYLQACFGCLAATLVNPYFLKLHVHVIRYLGDPFQAEHISEFQSLSFHHPLAMFFELFFLLAVGAAFWYAAKRSFVEPILILVFAHGALQASRNMALFAIAAAPPISWALHQWIVRLSQSNAGLIRTVAARVNAIGARTAELEAYPRWRLASVAGMALMAALVFAPNPPKKFRPEFDARRFPVKAVETLASDSSARILSHDQWGDYLIYRLYPGNRVFLDGRTDFYGSEFEEQTFDIQRVKYGWENALDRYSINTILIPPDFPLCGALKKSSDWRVAYDDGSALIFRKTDSGNQQFPAANRGSGTGRDREITKTQARGLSITRHKTTT